jgi:3-oxoacyl-[acyl-carrier protein] reductase
MQLQDKVVIITGAARGLGRAYALSLAAEGAAVVVGDVRDCVETAAAVEEAGGRALPVKLDVTSFESCKAMVDRAAQKFGRIDGLVNNAALFANIKGGRFDALPEEQWEQVMAVNVKGVWNCCKAAVPELRKAGGGSIVNISSLAAVYGLPYGLDYATSKAAVIGMTRSLARELGRDWIRVNAVGPSAVMTEGAKEYFGAKFDKAKEVIAQGQALQRNLETDDLVGTIVYLMSDASRFVTGQTLMVDGGTVFL